jgi:hypothetical protein
MTFEATIKFLVFKIVSCIQTYRYNLITLGGVNEVVLIVSLVEFIINVLCKT